MLLPLVVYLQLPVQVGMYSSFLKEWLSAFPRGQIMFVLFEDYINNRAEMLNQMFEHLGVGEGIHIWINIVHLRRPLINSEQ